MGLTTTITSKGQITFPVAYRRRSGLNKGDKLLLVPIGEDLFMFPEKRLTRSNLVSILSMLKRRGASAEDLQALRREAAA